jgi:NodT family efflux transporter outer membrane factor (OMF) lipoprotein
VISAAHRLAVLNGEEPGAFLAQLNLPSKLPALPDSVAVGTPESLLRRRPDIIAAERRLHSATAQVGVATADLFPRITLDGFIGSASMDLGDLFRSDSETYGWGPSIGWAFLDLGRVRARIEATEAGASESLALYEGTVLRALEETENALVVYTRSRREREHLEASAEASVEAARLAGLRYEGGATDFLQVLDAERTLLDAQDRLAQSHTRVATSLVAVYKAVAGGWPERLPELATR